MYDYIFAVTKTQTTINDHLKFASVNETGSCVDGEIFKIIFTIIEKHRNFKNEANSFSVR